MPKNYLYKTTLILLLVFISCESTKGNLVVDAADPQLHLNNGSLYYKGMLFKGRLISTYYNGNKKSEALYNDGRKDGEEKQWYPEGSMESSRVYLKGYKVGTHHGWWPNGNVKFEYHFNNNGQYNGPVTEWYASGQKFMAFNYVDGKESGSQQLWQEDGRIKANYFTKNGERYGLIGLKKCNPVETNGHDTN
ncbi:toxin-antitoxin system YwqK family antitoxin [Cyclobacterium amurskyense]|uniref:Exported 24-amino acid repeat protein n=1 Tax=Cyclobacterium amurskyense TaxID=320787 RepID=A0A0H4PFG4_9BACT|nr:hypothetical protein [Cyclobacterium amurskyense]AKP51558.1 hypothetical protein CA2015_2137 [Cyclobacterium amurskyense]